MSDTSKNVFLIGTFVTIMLAFVGWQGSMYWSLYDARVKADDLQTERMQEITEQMSKMAIQIARTSENMKNVTELLRDIQHTRTASIRRDIEFRDSIHRRVLRLESHHQITPKDSKR